MKTAFIQQKHNALKRGIEFDFTYEEWVSWWKKYLGSNWAKMRGCRRGQYVMARYYDDGPYAAHNVKCILAQDNHLERNKLLWKKRRAIKAPDWFLK